TVAGGHPAADQRTQPERAREVDVDHLAPELGGHLGESVVRGGDARVVDQDVDPAQLGVGEIDEPVDLLPTPDVGRVGHYPASGFGFYLPGRRGERVEAASDDDHVGSAPGEGPSRDPAEA